MKEYEQFRTASLTFREKYFYLPGDLPNAIQFWGAAAAAGAACSNFQSTDQRTCDGNGNGQILQYAGSREPKRAWQHLANAKLIAGGPYDGYDDYAASKLKGLSWQLDFLTTNMTNAGDSWGFWGSYGNTFTAGRGGVAYDALKIDEIQHIDIKLDDGKPATGKAVVTNGWGISNCTDATLSSTLTANYVTTSLNGGCGIMFRQQF